MRGGSNENYVTDSTALYAIKQIFEFLSRAVKDGSDIEAIEQMCYACFLNGIAFSNAGLGKLSFILIRDRQV